MTETSLEKAERRYEQARARLQALKNREAEKQRKLDTRRKVILGGALMDLAERDDGARAMLDRLVRNLGREQDRAVFADWAPPGRGDAAVQVSAEAPGGVTAERTALTPEAQAPDQEPRRRTQPLILSGTGPNIYASDHGLPSGATGPEEV